MGIIRSTIRTAKRRASDIPAVEAVAMLLERSRPLRLRHRKSGYATHQPVLVAALAASSGPVLELGCGGSSTPLLHRICERERRPLVTVENSPEYFARYSRRYQSDGHRFEFTADWAETLERHAASAWGLVFVDMAPWDVRAEAVMKLRDSADYVVLHDCDDYPAAGIFGSVVEPFVDENSPGRRSYGDVFKHWKEFQPPSPWPTRTGPPTLLASNRHSCELDADFGATQLT